MITQFNIQDALPYLIKNNDTFILLKNDFADILADLISFKNNPNCSCKARVMKFFTEQLQKDPLILNKYIHNEQDLNDELVKAQKIRQLNNYSGKIITLPKNEEAWKNFALDINKGKTFRSFSVVERDDSIVVYFL